MANSLINSSYHNEPFVIIYRSPPFESKPYRYEGRVNRHFFVFIIYTLTDQSLRSDEAMETWMA